MNPIKRAYRRLEASLKSFTMRFASNRSSWGWTLGLGRTRIDYAGQVGDGRGNSIVAACLAWMGRTLPEAPLQVVRVNADGSEDVVRNHPLTRLLTRPNPYYSGALLLGATASDFKATGNAYWLKVRSDARRPVQLWWVPSTLIEPKYPDDGSVFISHYEYSPGGVPIRLEAPDPVSGTTGDVVHFRNGIDPWNPRKGLSEIASLVREIATDDEAANFTAGLLRNLGVPGVIIAPDSDDVDVTQEVADETKARFAASFGGDNRGAPLVMRGKTKVTVLSFSPEQMNLRALRGIPEERISAMLGIPAAVVGLGSGLANTKVGATMAEMREQAYESAIIPTQRLFAAEITAQLLPDLGNPATEHVEFDLSEVRILQPDLDKLHVRLDVAVRGGWMTPNEARQQVDLAGLPGGDVLYVPVSVVPTDPAMLIPPEPAALPEPAPLRALPEPAPKGRQSVETKASAHVFADGVTRIRRRHQAPLERELASFLEGQRGRVVAALNAQEKALTWQSIFDAVAEETGLRRVLEKWYRRVLTGVHSLTEDAIGTSWELDDPGTRKYLADAGAFISDISAHTRADIARELQEGQALGEGIPQLAKRIESMTAFNRARATAVARTELGRSANLSAVHSYRASGLVESVKVFDGTDDDDACRAAHGQTWTLDQAASNPLQHTNCRRAFGAVVGAAAAEDAA